MSEDSEFNRYSIRVGGRAIGSDVGGRVTRSASKLCDQVLFSFPEHRTVRHCRKVRINWPRWDRKQKASAVIGLIVRGIQHA